MLECSRSHIELWWWRWVTTTHICLHLEMIKRSRWWKMFFSLLIKKTHRHNHRWTILFNTRTWDKQYRTLCLSCEFILIWMLICHTSSQVSRIDSHLCLSSHQTKRYYRMNARWLYLSFFLAAFLLFYARTSRHHTNEFQNIDKCYTAHSRSSYIRIV